MGKVDASLLLVETRRKAVHGTARSVRKKAGLTLQQVGDICGVTPSTVHRWETTGQIRMSKAALTYAEFLQRIERLVAAA